MFKVIEGQGQAKKKQIIFTSAYQGTGKQGHIVADTNVSPFARACATFVADTKNVSDFVQKHFVSATNVSQFAQPKKHHEQQCVRNNVSSFASTFMG